MNDLLNRWLTCRLSLPLYLSLIGLCFLGVEPVHAGETATQPAHRLQVLEYSLEDLENMILEHSPMLAAERARVGAARERAGPAGALPDPMLDLSANADYMNNQVEFGGGTIEVSQEFPFPGKRKMLRQAGEAEADVRLAELHIKEREVISQLRIAYGKLYALDQEREYLNVARDLLKMIAATAGARYSVGEADQEGLLKAQLAVSRLFQRSEDLLADRQAVVAEINRLLDRPGDEPIGVVKNLPAVTAPSIKVISGVDQIPDVTAKLAAIQASERRLDAARKDRYPNFIVGIGGGTELNVVDNSRMPMAMVRFGVTLPVWQGSKQKPMIRAAEQEKIMSKEEARDAAATVRAELARLNSEWQRSERQIILYKEAVLPQTMAAFEAARASYIAGRGDFATVYEDFNLWMDARTELARRESERFTTWAQMEALRPLKINTNEKGEQE